VRYRRTAVGGLRKATWYPKKKVRFARYPYGEKETETSLTLCLEKSREQQDVILLAENAYNECQKQGKRKGIKIETIQASWTSKIAF